MNDSEIRHAILSELRSDDRLSSQPIKVLVEHGQVTLRGTVQSFRRKLVAQEIASIAVASNLINNELEVDPPENPSDPDIADDVRGLLEQHGSLIKEAVLVEVRAGRVTLSGSVSTDSERIQAEDLALRAPGVRTVANHLVVEPSARTEATVVGRELANLLATDSELNGCEFRVAISGDVALLSGTAGTEAQLERAVGLIRGAWVGELRREVVLLG